MRFQIYYAAVSMLAICGLVAKTWAFFINDHQHHRKVIIRVPIITHTVYKIVEKQPKHAGKVVHHHHHDGHVAHVHKHEGDARHKHKHRGTGGHHHSHVGSGEHKHWHSGKAEHGHLHEGNGVHDHRHKGYRGGGNKNRRDPYSYNTGFDTGSVHGHRLSIEDNDRFEPEYDDYGRYTGSTADVGYYRTSSSPSYKYDHASVNNYDSYAPAFYSNIGNANSASVPVVNTPPYAFYNSATSSRYNKGEKKRLEYKNSPSSNVNFNLFSPEETAELENSLTNFDEFGDADVAGKGKEEAAPYPTYQNVASTYDENETEPERNELKVSKIRVPYRDENYLMPIVPYEVTENTINAIL